MACSWWASVLNAAVLIYPKTDAFHKALPVFEFPKASGLRLWVLPFCLKKKCLLLPPCGSLDAFFVATEAADPCVRKIRTSASASRALDGAC